MTLPTANISNTTLSDVARRISGRARVAFASESAEELLKRNGLADIAAIFNRGSSAQCRHLGRAVWDTTLTDDHGRSVRAFIKMSWGRQRFLPRVTDVKTGQLFQSLPAREWNGIEKLSRIGLNVPERLALFHEGLISPRSVVIVREVPPKLSIEDMIQNGQWSRLAPHLRASLLDEVIATMRTIFTSKLAWRGVSSRHFYPALQPDQTWKLWLIDCEGVHGRVNRKVIKQGYKKLMKAMRGSQADEPTLLQLQSRIDRELEQPFAKAA